MRREYDDAGRIIREGHKLRVVFEGQEYTGTAWYDDDLECWAVNSPECRSVIDVWRCESVMKMEEIK